MNFIVKSGSVTDDIKNYTTRVGVSGYRCYHNYQHIKNVLDDYHKQHHIDLLISGGCLGVDVLAEKWADENNVPKKILLPNLKFGKRGYFLRDEAIVEMSTYLIAFPSKNGKGTQLTMKIAVQKGIEVMENKID